jgi:hypothetical protein
VSDSAFSNKPADPTLEFAELRTVFSTRQLAAAFGRDPDTIARWAKRVPHTTEAVVDRFWYVVHVATTHARWDVEDTRWFLLSIQPRLGGRVPADLIREGALDEVLEAISGGGTTTEEEAEVENPFAAMIAPEPITSETIFGVKLAPPELEGRMLPLEGFVDEDPGVARYLTVKDTIVIPVDSLED